MSSDPKKKFESKFDDFEKMAPVERREFLKYLGGLASLPLFSDSLKFAMFETLVGKAQAQVAVGTPINFLEVNFRDQWDFGSVFVAPGIATNYANLAGKVALFNQPTREINNHYLTPAGAELRPHLDSIAVMELGENTLTGSESVHGHEAGNPLRSPGRVKGAAAGKIAMDTVDKRPGDGGNEPLYSSTPTPLILHNYYQKSQTPGLRNGVIMRSSVRPGTHTFYHFEGNLQNAQVDRFFDRDTLGRAFQTTQAPPTPTTLQKHGALVAKLLKSLDQDYMQRLQKNSTEQMSKLTALEGKLAMPPAMQPFMIQHSAQEMTYWKQGIPEALECPGDDAATCFGRTDLWNIGEIFGYAYKLFQAQKVRSIGIDFNMYDVHTNRTPNLMSTQGAQTAYSLARFITNMKTAGLWDRTLIAMFTLDGSRSPALSSTGDGTKNAVILAGGMIKGGYYGDVRMNAQNGTVTYHRPDDAGNPIAAGVTDRNTRVSAADVYKTIAKASGIPDSITNGMADVRGGKVLTYMLKG